MASPAPAQRDLLGQVVTRIPPLRWLPPLLAARSASIARLLSNLPVEDAETSEAGWRNAAAVTSSLQARGPAPCLLRVHANKCESEYFAPALTRPRQCAAYICAACSAYL